MDKILIVDDQSLNVILLERILRNAGYEDILTTTDSRTAVELCLGYLPDIVLLDLAMPALDGFGVLAQLRASETPAAAVPVLILTADPTHEVRRRVLEAGAQDLLLKPFDTADVEHRVRTLLETPRT
jgi:putative two-component system response regulator